jgi:hypothetical protein
VTTLKDPPASQVEELTYAKAFLLAKAVLQDGDFDNPWNRFGQETRRLSFLLGDENSSDDTSNVVNNADGSTTTIGYGSSSVAAAAATTTTATAAATNKP